MAITETQDPTEKGNLEKDSGPREASGASLEQAESLKEVWLGPEISAAEKDRAKKPIRASLGRERSARSLILIGRPLDFSFQNVSNISGSASH